MSKPGLSQRHKHTQREHTVCSRTQCGGRVQQRGVQPQTAASAPGAAPISPPWQDKSLARRRRSLASGAAVRVRSFGRSPRKERGCASNLAPPHLGAAPPRASAGRAPSTERPEGRRPRGMLRGHGACWWDGRCALPGPPPGPLRIGRRLASLPRTSSATLVSRAAAPPLPDLTVAPAG